MRKTFSLSLIILSVGCVSGHCRQIAHAPTTATETKQSNDQLGREPLANSSLPASSNTAPNASSPAPNNPTSPGINSVTVYKPDGSQQCAMGSPVKIDDMEKELKGIPVLAREKKSDGLMHIQMCGSPTGMMNTYKIPTDKLAEAQKRGFKKWNF